MSTDEIRDLAERAWPDRMADAKKLGYVGRNPKSRDSNSWFTPSNYIESVRWVLGGIDLDPFTSVAADEIVKATRIYTEDDDAFTQDWKASTVWMNPPYSGKLVADAMNMFMDKFAEHSFESGIVLVNNATETRWFQRALREASAVCFTDHRIAFWNADGKKVSGNTRGQAFFLFGDSAVKRFETQFSNYGKVVKL